ncbi:MAG: 2Fe-2S iron-sulfur cluster-binding protein [Gloeobacterales cyanobacterium]
MPTIRIFNQKVSCNRGDNLRRVLLENKVGLYNGGAKVINCQGLGTCGTCAVEIEGAVSEPSPMEQLRAPLLKNRRLACQTSVLGDIRVKKYQGFWGLGKEEKTNKVQV